MKYGCGDAKNRSNIAKHGLDFAYAEQVLPGLCVTLMDDLSHYGEKRLVTVGLLAARVVVIARTPRGDNITRIIS